MLIVSLILAVIGLAALVTSVVTNNELIAWVCIGASGLGVLLLVVDAIRERAQRRSAVAAATTEAVARVDSGGPALSDSTEVIAPVEITEVIEPVVQSAEEYGNEDFPDAVEVEDHPEELVYDEPDYDLPSDDEPDFPEPAEEAALHIEYAPDADTADATDVAVEEVRAEDLVAEDVYAEDVVSEDVVSEGVVSEDVATEVHRLDGGDDAATVVSYVEQPRSAETEYRYVQSSETGYSYGATDSADTDDRPHQ